MKNIKHLDKVYYIKKIYRYRKGDNKYQSTLVRVQTETGSHLYRINKHEAMFFADKKTAEKYRKEGEQICELKLDKDVFLKSDSKNKDILKVAKHIEVSSRLQKQDGLCAICEIKDKEIERGWYHYCNTFCDEIVEGARGLTSGYYYNYGNPSKNKTTKYVYKNLDSALKEISKGTYDKFKKLYIKKVNPDTINKDRTVYKD